VRVDYAFIAEAADSQGGVFYVTRGGADIHFLPPELPRPLRLGALSFETGFEAHPIDPTRTTATVVTFRFYGFPVPEFGTYLFEVLHEEERLAQVPFWVMPAEAGQGPTPDGPPA